MRGQWIAIISLFFFFFCAFIFWSLMSCLLFEVVEHDSGCLWSFVYSLYFLSLVPLSRSYWGIEIVVSVM